MNIQELNELIRLHGAAVYSFCCRLAANRPDAEDLYQETVLKATELCRKIDRYDNPKAFLLAIALRLWKDKRRKFARRQRIAPMESLPEDGPQGRFAGAKEDQPEEIAIAREQVEMVRRAVEALDDAHRVPLYLYYTAELPIEEIASLLKLPKGTVKSRLYHARKAILKRLEAADHE